MSDLEKGSSLHGWHKRMEALVWLAMSRAMGAFNLASVPPAPVAPVVPSALFYSLTPGNTAVIAPANPVDFPVTGPTSGAGAAIRGVGFTQFVLPAIGLYEVTAQVDSAAAGQIVVGMDAVDGSTELAYTVVGRDTAHTQMVIDTLVRTTVVNSVLTIRNPAASVTSITRPPNDGAGAPSPISCTLVIKRIA